MNDKISFPHLGSYHIPIKYILEKTTKLKVIIPPNNTKATIHLGSKYSQADICMPFKYNLGNYIEALNQGATYLIQGGGGCRYGYYAELQCAILKDLGYKFTFINLIKNNHVSLLKMYKFAKKVNKKLNPFTYIYHLLVGLLIMLTMDKVDSYYRKNKCYEIKQGSFDAIKSSFYHNISMPNQSIIKVLKQYQIARSKYKKIPVHNQLPTTILLIGELYSLMELNSSNNLEEKLLKENIQVIRYTNLTYLLITKRFMRHYLLHKAKKYLKYPLGADGTESVVHALNHSKKSIDGIIHMKSYGCVPEINAMPILNEISEDYNVPILYLSFDGDNNIANLDTKLEAFFDMINMKKQKNNQETK